MAKNEIIIDRLVNLGHELFEGDIILDEFEFEYDHEIDGMDDAVTKKSRFWEVTDGIVTIPYTEGNFLTHEERSKIQLAIAEYNSKTCIR